MRDCGTMGLGLRLGLIFMMVLMLEEVGLVVAFAGRKMSRCTLSCKSSRAAAQRISATAKDTMDESSPPSHISSPSITTVLEDQSALLLAAQDDEIQAVGCISHHEAMELLALRSKLPAAPRTTRTGAQQKGKRWFFQQGGVSLDLGKTETSVVVSEEGICLPVMGRHPMEAVLVATWEELQEIVDLSRSGQVGCYTLYLDGTKPWRVTTISLRTGRSAVLHPPLQIRGPPTMVLGSLPMHRLGEPYRLIGPAEDTRRKLDTLKMKNVYGRVLDTATGLGYTAIAASRCSNVREVVTVELDQAALELCRYNPWSSELFKGMANSKIRMLHGDICEVIKTFPDRWFSAVIHDPPSPSICKSNKSLFGASFYAEIYRVMRWRGRLFHYVGGNPKSKEYAWMYRAVMMKLEAAGFKASVIHSAAQGVVAEKGEDRKSKKGRLHAERLQQQKRRPNRPKNPPLLEDLLLGGDALEF